MTAAVLIRTSWLGNSLSQRLPSGPAAIAKGPLLAVGIENSVMTPVGVIRAILLPWNSGNHRLPSGPVTMSCGWLANVGTGNSSG